MSSDREHSWEEGDCKSKHMAWCMMRIFHVKSLFGERSWLSHSDVFGGSDDGWLLKTHPERFQGAHDACAFENTSTSRYAVLS